MAVIIPTLDEAGTLPATLARLARWPPAQVVVADGGSTDDTVAVARRAGATVVHGPRGRGAQMNRGAAATTAPLLLFLHADTLVPAHYPEVVAATLARPGVAAGAFSLALDNGGLLLAAVAQLATWRARHLGLAYGDQGLFVTRRLFQRCGGFPEEPFLEDLLMARKLRRYGRLAVVTPAVCTSARRWQRHGVVRTTLLNQFILLGWAMGVSPARLGRWYHGLRRS